ncbi:MAG: cytochrome c1, partial [Gammaproteobacteria bacterium]
MRRLKIILCSFLYMVSTLVLAAESGNDAMRQVKIDLTDQAALQRGARMYMNYCAGCHSLEYLRYSRFAQDLGITDNFGQVDQTLLKNNLIFTTAKAQEPIKTAMLPEDSREWFGIEPPDLSLSGRVHGAE